MIERIARALKDSLSRRPCGGYDYGYNEDFYGPAPEAGRYVVRCERTNKILHQTNDHDAHEAAYELLTNSFHARAAIKAMREPSPAMVDAFVSRALQVRLGGDYRWSDYARDQWAQMIDAALAEDQTT